MRPGCRICGKPVMAKGWSKNGKRKWESLCATCYEKKKRFGTEGVLHIILDKCEHCGFIPVNFCQMDIDHIDGDEHNNDRLNLRVLCANCHRLKTFQNRDWESRPSLDLRIRLL